ncbi:uncharacterized protein TNCV_2008191 [Trichonephila clavipes]|nr:uncharacterized protein TNCV_2008191 [Trichonephila clavipes]
MQLNVLCFVFRVDISVDEISYLLSELSNVLIPNSSLRKTIVCASATALPGLRMRKEYREKALRIELKSKRVLENIKSKQNNNEGSNSGNNSHLADCENPYKAITPRLPEVELYKFGGELKDWLTFWNQFKNIHENKNLTNCDTFHYLVQSTKIKSEARELIESFPITNENYPLAIESLVERYRRNELLIDFYVRELLKLVLNNATKKKQDSLSGLYNKLSTQLRALSSLEDIPVSSLWDLEMLGIRDTIEQNSRGKGKCGYVSLSRNSSAKRKMADTRSICLGKWIGPF